MGYSQAALCQVQDMEREITHKLCTHNAFLRAKDLDLQASCPRGTSSVADRPVSMFCHHLRTNTSNLIQVLRAPELYKSSDN